MLWGNLTLATARRGSLIFLLGNGLNETCLAELKAGKHV